MTDLQQRIAGILDEHRPKRIRRGIAGGDFEQCQKGCKYEPGACYEHFARVLVSELGFTREGGANISSVDGVYLRTEPIVYSERLAQIVEDCPKFQRVTRYVTEWVPE